MADRDRDEQELSLRTRAFRRAGFSESEADALAARREIAYLEARTLLQQGFPPEIAASMLLDGHRSVF